MTVDLSYDELVLLIQLVNQRFVEIQRKDPEAPEAKTSFEVALCKKLYEAHMDEMKIIKEDAAAGKRTLPQSFRR
jgi:hypothetical protein